MSYSEHLYPLARVHLTRGEQKSAAQQGTWLDRKRYRPQQWSSRPRWRAHDCSARELWQGFRCVRPLEGIGDDVLFLPLHRHTLGHASVAWRTDPGLLLVANDAYFDREPQ